MLRKVTSPLTRYAGALVLTAIALALTVALSDYLSGTRFLMLIPAVAIVAWYGGLGPAMLTAAIGILGVDYFLIPPVRSLSLSSPSDIVPAAIFFGLATFLSHATGVIHADRTRANESAAEAQRLAAQLQDQATELEQQVEEQQALTEELEATNEQLHQSMVHLDEARNVLAGSEERLRLALEAGGMGAWEWSIAENRARWSETLERIHGMTPGSFSGTFDEYQRDMHPDDRERVLGSVQQSLAGQEHHLLYRIIRRDGEVRWVEAWGRLLRDAQGNPARLAGISTDVTERQRAEDASRFIAEASRLLASSLEYETTLRNVARLAVPALADWCAVDLLDPGGELRRVAVEHPDPSKLELVKTLEARYPADRNAPRGVHQVIRSGKTEYLTEIPEDLLVTAAQDDEHLRIIRTLGLRSYIIAPLVGRDAILGTLTLVSAESGRRFTAADVAIAEDLAQRAAQAIDNARLVQDLSESRELLANQAAEMESQTEELSQSQEELQVINEELWQANDELASKTTQAEVARAEAEEANRAKSEFLAMMSHELRTPLNAIAGYTELLEMGVRGPVSEAQRTDLMRIRRSQKHLLALINDVLNFAKLEAGRVEFDLSDVSVHAVLEEVEPLMAPQLRERQLEFNYAACPADLQVRADPEKVRQIVLNLLSNSAKFTNPGGRIAIGCTTETESVHITIADTGIGIPAEQLDRIFEPFVQLSRELTRTSAGTGLGLSISRDLARRMGGDLTARSELGRGSSFTLTLPRANAMVAESAPHGEQSATAD